MNEYMTLGAVSVAIVLMIATMFISSRLHYSIKAIAIVVAVAGAIYNWELFASVLGYPIAERPPNNAIIIATVTKKETKKIYALVDGIIPRTYTIPYSEPFDKKLEQAKKQLDPRNGRMVYKVSKKVKGKGKSLDATGKHQEGKEAKGDGKEGTGTVEGNAEAGSISERMKDKIAGVIKQVKTTLNISEDDAADDDALASNGKNKEGKEAKHHDGVHFEDDDTINDGVEIESLLPRKD